MFPGQNLISQMLPASRDIRQFRQQMQQQQQMGGGSYQNSVNPDYGRPAGPDALGLGPAQDRSNWRDFYNNMSPALSFGLGMVPGIGTAFNIGRLANAGLSAYESSQLAPSRDARERAQDQFRASEIADMNAPQYGPYADDSMDRLSFNTPAYGQAGPEYGPAPAAIFDPNPYEGGVGGFGPAADRLGGTFNPNAAFAAAEARNNPNFSRDAAFVEASRAAYNAAPAAVVGNLIAPSSLTGVSLPNMAGNFGNSYGGSDNMGNTGNFGGVTGGADTMGFGGTYAHGGRVQLKDLIQPGPGKDDGYGGLQDGEYVIKKDAVKRYGVKMLEKINQRKVSKKQVSNFFKNHG
jgi:hypothetical protein